MKITKEMRDEVYADGRRRDSSHREGPEVMTLTNIRIGFHPSPCGCHGYGLKISNYCPTHRDQIERSDREFLKDHQVQAILVSRPSDPKMNFHRGWKPVEWVVYAYASGPGIDRNFVAGWITYNEKTARRMVDAVNAGAVLFGFEILTDVNGNTYVSSGQNVYWKHANKDLKALGF